MTAYLPGRLGFSDTADIDTFVSTLERYERGELDAEGWRAFRLLYGVYGQRQASAQMLRVKIPQGILTAAQLEALARVAEQYADGRGHITTRQNVQFYFIPLELTEEAMRLCAEAGLTTKEACGHSVRNVVANPLAGVDADEPFDVTPFADGLTRHFLRKGIASTLPRKFKIAFEGSRRDVMHAPINDLSFFAREQDGRRGFRVLVGGGTSTLARSGQVLVDFLPAAEVLGITEAVLRVFHREGERGNKSKARIKWLIKKLGWDAFKIKVEHEWALVQQEPGHRLAFDVDAPPSEPIDPKPVQSAGTEPEGLAAWRRTNAIAQKQPGLVAAVVTVPLGDLTPAQLRGLAAMSLRFSDGTVRTTIEQNLLLRHVPEGSLAALYLELQRLGLATAGAASFADVTTCAGAHTCAIAVTASRGVAAAVADTLREHGDTWNGHQGFAGASVKVSGCPNGCGQHHIASVGLQGGMRKLGGRPLPLYALSIGGGSVRDAGGQPTGARFARLVGKLPARRVTAAMGRLLGLWESQRGAGESFDDYMARVELGEVKRELASLFAIDEHSATEQDFIDLGQDTPFTTVEGEAECAM